MTYKNRFLSILAAACIAITLTGCDLAQNQLKHDRSANMERSDFREGLAERPLTDTTEEDIPAFQSFVSTPQELKPAMPLVSVSVNQTVSLRDLLFELADQAEVDIELDPQIRGSLIFTAREKPFDQVIDRLAKMAGLRYTFNDNLLRVELDRPYLKTYKIDYINVIRSIESEISIDVSVVSGGEADVGSAATMATETESDFWTELSTNLEQILTSSDNFISLATASDPQSMPRAPVVADADTTPPGPPVLDIQYPTTTQDPVDPNAPSAYSINKQAGLISVFASARQHNEVRSYLKDLRTSATAQVLIEAKILEVGLTDEYSAGIQWQDIDPINFTGLASIEAGFPSPGLTPAATGSSFTATLKPGNDISAAVSAISRFGTVRALSSPRLTVLNNQSAVLSVVENRIFFELDVNTEEDGDTGDETVEVDSEIRSVPEGIMVNVMPTVNTDTHEISLALRPTITRVVGTVDDPGVAIALLTADPANAALLDDVRSPIPQLAVQEMDSVLKVQSGQVLVMGGLMQDRNEAESVGVPIASDIPLFGNLFKNQADRIEKSELVIFLKATLIPGRNADDTDKDMYNNFGFDRHPFKL